MKIQNLYIINIKSSRSKFLDFFLLHGQGCAFKIPGGGVLNNICDKGNRLVDKTFIVHQLYVIWSSGTGLSLFPFVLDFSTTGTFMKHG